MAEPALTPEGWAPPSGFDLVPARRAAERLAYGLFALFIFFTCFTFLRPSPYDFAAIPAMLVWFALGLRLHRATIVFVALLVVYHLSLVVALLPYLGEPDPTAWTFQSVYLMVTCIFFVMFFADSTRRRIEFALKAYLASCIFAAVAGILSYFVDTGVLFVMDSRAAGVFEDPNVLGSFLILGQLYLLRALLTGEARHPVLSGLAMLLLLAAIFLSFSRGSWGATIAGSGLLVVLTYRTSPVRIRRRIAGFAAGTILLGAVLVSGLLSIGNVEEQFASRATIAKDYDEGVTGRFGNQLRSIPMLIERPEGFGPLRFRLVFGLEPHNSYIGGFANGGWVGGLSFLGLVLATIGIGFRLCFSPSPYRRQAQVVFPATLMFFLQAAQIDIDHWRHVYMMLGMVWGLEAARVRWMRARSPTPAHEPRFPLRAIASRAA